jgi:hypothetical protein
MGLVVACLWAGSALGAGETEVVYLSGKGNDDGVKWDFWCSAGQNSGKWGTIDVPSNWELQGYGIYSYGRDQNRNGWPKVQGKYKRTFNAPAGFEGKRTYLVFEGSMTDTQAFINGQSAGPMHQGGYYRFKYDVSKLLKAGENLLEVTVDDESANASVNNAERRGDYWNYAGIFRPVELEVVPKESIDQVAIDAKADGTFSADVEFAGIPAPLETGITMFWTVEAQVMDSAGKAVGPVMTQKVPQGSKGVRLTGKYADAKLWNAETPNLYHLQVRLKDPMGADEHEVTKQFGFRTVEAKAGEGILLNGQKIMLKGADRHSFWPDSGRCLSDKICRDDILVMKEMNMNAVRCSHYPPDQHFLDMCDEMGMYVLDELAGWHQAYDTPTGVKLVEEMVKRDVNHPSVLFWDNGNEGGWNNALDTEFAKWDPTGRHVLHPQQTIRGIDNTHYPAYNAVVTKSAGNNPVFYTEMLHGLYDGGGGAGLEDYWKVMTASKVAAGGFIWSLVDEDVKRTDKGGRIDSMGNQAPDGILGPYREKEGSFYTVKQVWSPIVMKGGFISNSTYSMEIENRFDFIDAKDCSFTWETRRMHGPNEPMGSDAVASGTATMAGSIPPHTKGTIRWDSRASLSVPNAITYVHVFGPDKKELTTFALETSLVSGLLALPAAAGSGVVKVEDGADGLVVTAGELALKFNKQNGQLAAVSRAGKGFSLINGPKMVEAAPPIPPPAGSARGAAATPAPPLAESTLTSLTQKMDGADVVVTAAYEGAMKSVVYRVRPNGWMSVDWAYHLTGTHELFGVGFDYPEEKVQGMRYLGNGPATVYQNRLAGGTLDVWEKKYNNTMVGDPDDLPAGAHFEYPVFKGYYAGMKWAQLQTSEGPITALVNQDDLYVQVLTPKVPPANLIGQSGVPFANSALSFLHAIPAIGSKFTNATTTGPMGQPAVAKGDYKGSISLYFGELK